MRDTDSITKKILANEKGIALISALMLSLIGMLMVASLLLMVGDTGSWTSGSKIRYQVALAAAHGGMNFFVKEILPRGIEGTGLSALGTYGGLLTPVISNANLTTKLTTRGDTRDGFWPYDPNMANSGIAFGTTDVTVTFTPANGRPIAVDTAIVSTSRGNSSTSSNLLQTGGVVNNNSGTITPQHIPYIYQTETRGQNATNPTENARLSSIYVY